VLILLIILIVLAVGGFGHGGYQRGWYGRDPYYAPQRSAGFGSGGLGLIVFLVVLWLIFGHHHFGYYRY